MADPIEQNILGVQQLVGSKMNKLNTGAPGNAEGVEGEFEDDFTLKLTDDELLHLARLWENDYRGYEEKIKIRQQANLTYYLGKQKEGTSIVTDGPISANLLFEAEETFIPAALAKNPEPVVWADNTPEGTKISSDVKTMLQYHADTLVLRRKLGQMVRNWSVDFLGVIKHGWDETINDIKSDVRDVKNFIFDPNCYIDVYGDYDGPLGERITIKASKLVEIFPKHKDYIIIMVDGKMGTDCVYTEWWNDDYCFYTFKNKVLDKHKNPNFNYPKVVPALGSDGTPEVDEFGQPVIEEVKGNNHFSRPKKPYTFLSVFSLGNQPHDVTGLIEQNIPNQRRISRRTEQIDYNLSRQNNSDVFSANNFTQETAKQAATAMAKGHPVLVPTGAPIGEAIHRLSAEGLHNSFFDELENSKNDLRSIFGTQGITASETNPPETARGMILNSQHDSSRIGGGIGDAIEQVADNVFNHWTQMYYVFYDEPHFAAIMGQMKAVEYITLTMTDLNRRLVISVAPDSMKAHDEISEMNQALTLWQEGALDPKTLLTVLNFPDPQNTAAQVMLYKTNPAMYMQLNFPDLVAQIQSTLPAQMGAPQPGAEGASVPGSPPLNPSEPEASAALSQVPINSQSLPK